MSDEITLPALDSRFKKVAKWRLAKLEKYHTEERGLVSAIRSTIRRLEGQYDDHIERASTLVGEPVTQDTLNSYIERLETKSRVVELQNLDRHILTIVKQLDDERDRLQHHVRVSELLLREIKLKSI